MKNNFFAKRFWSKLLMFVCAIFLWLAGYNEVMAQSGNALSFDGTNDYVVTPTTASLAMTSQMTIETWVKPTATNGVTQILRVGGAGDTGAEFQLTSTPALRVNINFGGSWQTYDSTPVSLNNWYHLALTVNGTTATIYINGTSVATRTGSANLNTGNGFVYLGKHPAGTAYFSGLLDELRVWNVTRTASEISTNYNKSLAGNETGLVAYYNFNQGTPGGTNTSVSSMNDLTSNANNGTLTNFALTGTTSNWVVSGVGNNALDFDGTNDYVSVPNGGGLNNLQSGTIEMWVKWNGTQGGSADGYGAVCARQSNNYFSNQIIALTTSDPATAKIKWMPYGYTVAITSTISPGNNQWVHIAVTYQSGSHKLYINGVQDGGTSTLTGTINNNSAVPFYIGAWAAGGNCYSKSQIDEVRVWNTIRTASEISSNYNTTLAGNETGLVAYYNFNSGIAAGTNTGVTTVTDLTASGYNGTLTNFALSGSTSNWVSTSTTVKAPVMNVKQSNTSILDDNGTFNFGSLAVGTSKTVTFTVENTGNATLNLTGSPRVTLTGTGFALTTDAVTTVTTGSSTTFQVTLTASSASAYNGTISIPNNDIPRKPYNFTITGTGINATAGNALAFDGTDDYVNLGTVNLNSTNFTLMGWIRWDALNNYSRIFDIANGPSSNNIILCNQLTTNTLDFEVFNGTTSQSIAVSNTIIIGQNIHVAAVLNSGTMSLYANGVLIGTKTGVTCNNLSRASSYLGKSNWGTDGYFKGAMDEVSIWNVGLSQSNIQTYMNQSLAGNESGLLAYYNFNHGTAGGTNTGITTLTDYAGGDNNGTVTNSALSGTTSNWVSSTASVVAPAMNVKQSSTTIADNSGSFNFGSISANSSRTVTFTVENTGTATLNLTGTPRVTVSGTGFTLATDAATTVSSGGTTTFQVTLSPTSSGAYSGTISIADNDAPQNPYNFSISGTGINSTAGNALAFDGTDDYVNLGTINFNSSNFTVMGWVRWDVLTSGMRFFDFGRGTTNNILLSYTGTSGGLYFEVLNGTSNQSIIVDNLVTAGQYAHVAAVASGGTTYLYVNGILVGTKTGVTVNNVSRANCYLGKSNWANAYFNGQMDEVSIWNIGLSQGNIQSYMNKSLIGNESGLLAYYNFNHGTAGGTNTGITTLTDYAGADNNGTLTNSALSGTTSNWVSSTASITGAVISGSAGIAGATLSYTDGIARTATADASGNYSIIVSYNWSGTVTPSKSGYIFSPTTKTYASLTTNQTAQNYNATMPMTFPGNALYFDGTNDYISNSTIFTTAPTSFTVEWWLYPLGYSDYNQGIAAQSANWGAFTFHTTATGAVYTGTEITNRLTANELKANTVTLNTWQHFAFAYTGGIGYFYKNGVLLASRTMNAPAAWNGITTFLSSTDYINGKLDELRIWNVGRTQAQIQSNMNLPLAGNETGLVAYYNFDQGTAGGDNTPITALVDKTSNAHIATITNFAKTGTTSNFVASTIPALAIISGSAGIAGATLSYTDGTAKTATADASGNYSFAVSNNWSGTVTPSLTGYTFSPANKAYSNVIANQTTQDYTATLNTYTISGNAGIAGVTLSYTNGTAKTVTADASGDYSFSVPYNWSGTVTPSLAGYTFSPTSKTYSSIAANQISQYYNATTPMTFPGNALAFDGSNDYVNLGNPATFNFDGVKPYTLEAWVMLNAIGTEMAVIGKYNRGIAGQFHITINTAGAVIGSREVSPYGVTSTQVLQTGKYYHLATTYDGANLSLYINGILEASVAMGTIASNTDIVLIGSKKNLGSPAYFFNGNIDEVRIWNIARTQSEIQSAMNSPLAGNETGLLAYYNSDQGIAGGTNTPITALVDKTANANNGTLYNFAKTGSTSNFVAGSIPVTISGNAGIAGAILSYTDGIAKTATADANGNYSLMVSYNWSGTVIPSKISYTFSTISKLYTNVTTNQTAQNYNAVTPMTYPGNALNFDGTNDYIDIGALNLNSTNFTFMAWLRWDVLNAGSRVFDFGNGAGSDNILLSYGGTTNKLYYAVCNGPTGQSFVVSDAFTTGQYVHVAAVVRSGTMYLYANGTLIGTKTGVTLNNVSRSNCYIGKSNWADPYFYGNMDEVSIWNIGLSQSQIQTYMTQPPAGNESGLMVQYKFDQGTASGDNTPITAAVDKTANGRDGVLTNFAKTGSTSNFVASTTPFLISGNAGIANATISYTDGTAKTATADASGNYFFTVSNNWSGSVSPSLTGYTFTPASKSYSNIKANQANQDFTAAVTTYTISGNAGIASATLSYTDGTAKTATADASGNYSLTVTYNWSGTVTPSLSGYTFSPVNKTYANIAANQTAQNYTATIITYTISGAGIAIGAVLTYTDGTVKTATVNDFGIYSITIPNNWSGTVTPSKVHLIFTPTSRTYTNVTANQGSQNYSSVFATSTISGSVGVGGVDVYYGSYSVISASDGSYSFTVTEGWTGDVIPMKAGYTFSPDKRTYTDVTGNQTTQNFTPVLNTYTISGNAGVAGVTLSYTDGTAKTATADASGNYSFIVSYLWTGTVTPSKTSYTFSPANKAYSNVSGNQTSQNYTATLITYTISGSAGVAGATLSYTDGTAKTATADGSGNYSLTVTENWSGTVTPSKTGYTFSPDSKTYSNVISNQTAQDYTAKAIIFTISGNAGKAGATLSFTDGTAKTATTDEIGNYSFTVSYNWSGTVTPSFTGYTFSPLSKTYSNVLANQTTQNYTATLNTYTISGSAGVAGATLSYTDGSAKTAIADGSGNYSITVPYNWSGDVTPSLTGYTFSPVSKLYSNVTSNRTAQNYVATAITYTISGNAGVAGATLSFTDGTAKTATADASGNYSFKVSYNWSRTVTPSLSYYDFSPVSKSYSNVLANQTAQDYTATVNAYTISGSAGIAGATLSYTDGTAKTATADASGNYLIAVSVNWSGTVIPTKTGYTFSPVSKDYTNVSANQTAQNYTATAITFTISGSTGIAAATLSYTDGTAKTATADGNGNYSFTVSYNWSGTVTPTLSGYYFTPASKTYSNVLANQTGQNYTAAVSNKTIAGNAGIAGATLSYTDVTAKTATADASGNYSLSVNYNWSGTVTPTKAGYTFSPANKSYTNVTANLSAENYTANILTYTISGNCGVASATLSYNDGTNKTTTADGSGNYSFTVPYNWSGSVTPTLSGYTFNPIGKAYANVTTNQTAQNYTITMTYAGNALAFEGGSAQVVNDEYVNLGSTNFSSTNFTIMGKVRWDALTNNSAYIDFSDAALNNRIVVSNIGATSTLYFKILAPGYSSQTISVPSSIVTGTWMHIAAVLNAGTMYLYVNGNQVGTRSTTTFGNINYTQCYLGKSNEGAQGFKGAQDEVSIWNVALSASQVQSYMLQPLAGTESGLIAYYKFDQGVAGGDNTAITTVIDKTSNAKNGTLVNFTKTGTLSNFITSTAGYSISGCAGIAGATLSYTDGVARTATADENGNYWFAVSNGWSGTVTPSKSGYTFSPATKTYSSVAAHQTAQNYNVLTSMTMPGNALSFDGTDDYVNLGTVNINSTNFTMMGWIRWDSFQNFSRVLDMGNGSNSNNILLCNQLTTNTLDFEIFNGTTSQSLVVANALTLGQYIHVAAVLNSGTMYLYTNGTLAGTKTGVTFNNIARSNCYMGKSNWTGDGPFNGIVDEFSIWNVALSNTQIQNYMTQALVGTESGLYAYYNFDQGTAGGNNTAILNATDKTTNARHATLTNFARAGAVSNFVNSSAVISIAGATGVANATLSYTDGTAKTVTSDASGNYSFAVPCNWSGTVTPSKSGNTFSPASRVYTSLTTNQSAQYYDVVTPMTLPGNALNFDGSNDYLTIPATINSAFTTNRMTVEAWIKPNAGNTNDACIITEAYLGDDKVTFGMGYQNATTFRVGFYNAGWTNITTTPPTNGVWTHVVFTYDQTAMNLYYNGVLQATLPSTMNIPAGTDEWRIGRKWDTQTTFNGTIDEIRIWNVALTLTEIQTTKQQSLTGTETGLVAYYNFDQGTADGTNTLINCAIDKTANVYNAVMNNFAKTGTTSNFVSSAAILSISGSAGIAGTTLSYTDGVAKTATSEASGNYTLNVSSGWSGTVTPSLSGYIFSPTSKTYSNVIANQTLQNYNATVPMNYPGNALAFNATNGDYLNIGSVNFNSTSFTVMGWVYLEDLTKNMPIFDFSNGSTSDNISLYSQTNAFLVFSIYNGGTQQYLNPYSSIGFAKYVHVAAIFNNGTMNLYANGSLLGTKSGVTYNNIARSLCYLGKGNFTGSDPFGGKLDEMSIWNVALSQSQVQNYMYQSLAGNETGLMYYYSFDQGIAGGNNTAITAAVDKTANAKDATLNNFTKTGTASNFITSTAVNTIKGNVGVEGVMLSYTDGIARTATSDANGDYSLAVSYNWSGTVTPTKANYAFTPTSKSYSNLTSNQTAQNYTTTITGYVISGNAGIAGATLSYTDGTAKTATADAGGNYSIVVSNGWSGTVTPSSTGWAFTPASRTYTNLGANTPAQDYTVAVARFTISGNAGTSGVTLSYTEGIAQTVTSDGSGNYSFTVAYNWNGTVTVAKTGYTFSPTNKVYANVASDKLTQNYTASVNYYFLSGNVGVAGVTISDGSGINTTSNDWGDYELIEPYGWSGNITPTKTGYTFSPVYHSYTNFHMTMPFQNFTAIPLYTISGNVGIAGAIISDGTNSVTSSGNGSYSISVANGWSGDITPTKTGYVFVPVKKSYSNVTSNQTAQNYSITITISGNAGMPGANVSDGTTTVISGVDGSYSFTKSSGWSGTITPTKFGYYFSPANQSFSNVSISQEQNFTATLPISGNTGIAYATVTDGTQTVNASSYGTYSILVQYNWSGTLTPAKTGYTFSPINKTYTDVTEVLTNQDFTATVNTYTISGNAGLSGATVSDGTTTVTTGADGLYSFTENHGWTGNIIPTKNGYTFAPVKLSYTGLAANQTNKNFTATADLVFPGNALSFDGVDDKVDIGINFNSAKFTIMGWFRWDDLSYYRCAFDIGQNGQNDIVVGNDSNTGSIFYEILNGSTSQKLIVADKITTGKYMHVAATFSSGTMYLFINGVQVGSKSGVTFKNVDRFMSLLGRSWNWEYSGFLGNMDEVSFWNTNLSAAQIKTYMYQALAGNESGLVAYYNFDQGIAGGDNTAITQVMDKTSNALHGTMFGFALTGPSSNFITSNTVAIISGNAGIGGATLTCFDGSLNNTFTADASGNYTIAVAYGWSGSVIPSKTDYTFTPANIFYSNQSTNVSNKNYTAAMSPRTITGSVGTYGVTLSYVDGTAKTVNANGSGNYSISVPYNWSGTVTPSKDGFSFSPENLSYSNVITNQTAQNYTATEIKPVISGNAGVGGATITYDDWDLGPRTVTADANGDYSFEAYYGSYYTVTPSKAGYSFFPVNRVYNNVIANSSNQNYATTPGAPTNLVATPGNAAASIAFTAPVNNGGSAITNYEYSTDNGTSWTACSPVVVTSPVSISGLTNGTTYLVKLHAVNAAGPGTASASVSVAPVTPCYNPTNGGTIASDQNGMGPFNPAAFTSTIGASGQTGTLEYKWVASTTSSITGYSDISSSNSATYDSGNLAATTWFKRLARVSCAADWSGAVESNVLQVTIASEPTEQPTTIYFSNTVTDGNTNIVVNFTASESATGYVVVRNTGSAPTFVPEDGLVYATGAQGSDQILYVGPATLATDWSITSGTGYYYAVYAYKGDGTNRNYLTSDPLSGTTLCFTNNTGTLPSSPGEPVSAGFPDVGINVTFPDGTSGTTLTATKTSDEPSANFSVLPGVQGISPLYITITSSTQSPGSYVLVFDFSSLGLAQDKWASFIIMKRTNSTSAWFDIASLGGSITNRCTDGVWGKFTVSGLSSFSDFAGGEAAVTHTVTSASETGPGTLKQCILDATAGDFINFNLTSMGTNTIKLTSPVVIGIDLTIQGAASGIVLDGNNATQVMEIIAASGPQPVVRMEKLTFTKGNDAANVVGGIKNFGDLLMVNCLVIDNADTGVNGTVGAVGGIYSTGNLTLINTTVAGNVGATGNGGIGGICLIEPVGTPRTLKLYNSIFYGNTGQFQSIANSKIAESYSSLYEETLDVLKNSNSVSFTQGTPGLDNKFANNPKFVGKANNATHPYLILGASPCVDGGNDTYNFDDTDIRGAGFGRKLDKTTGLTGTIDIGAYEWKKGTDPNNIFTWTGTSGTDWATAGNWNVNDVPQPEDIVTIPNVTNQPVAVALALSQGGKLTIESNASVTTTGSVVNNGTIIIRSDINGTGSLITSENATGSGQALVERYMSKNQWHIISSPTGTQTIGNFLTDNIDIPIVSGTTPVQYGMMDYNTAQNGWNPYFTDAKAGTLGIGKGYMVRVEEPVQTMRFQGILNAPTTTTVTTGWNCIGNPFTSAIRIIGVGGSNNFIGANASAFESSFGALYFWNQASTKYDVVTLGDLSGFYASVGQGFFMKAKAGATSVSFTPAMQVNNNEAPFKATDAPIPTIQLMVESGSKKASTDIRFVEGTTKGLDFGYDAGLFSTDKSFALYTKLVEDNGVDFQLQCLPTNQYKDLVIPIGIDSKAGGEIVFTVQTVQLAQVCTVVLEDRLTNTLTDLSTGSYKATVAANTAGTGRFFLHTGDIISGVEDQVLPVRLSAYARGNKEIRVLGNVGEGAVATLVNGLGKVVLTKILGAETLNIIGLPNLNSGIYLLKINAKGTAHTIKIMIRK